MLSRNVLVLMSAALAGLGLAPAAHAAAPIRPSCIGQNCEPTPYISTLNIAVPAAGAVIASARARAR